MNLRCAIRNVTALAVVTFVPFTSAFALDDHIVPLSEVHGLPLSRYETRQANIGKLEDFLGSEPVVRVLHTAKIDGRQVRDAVPMLSDAELSSLAARAQDVQSKFAAGSLSNQDLTYVVIALATAVVILVIVEAR